MICTFYSFKGGVGRSMALANIAELLCRRGARVLMVDFDLEAPGLERFFQDVGTNFRPEAILKQRGLIDMLLSYQEIRTLPRSALASTDGDAFFSVEPLENFVVPVYPDLPLGGSLSLLPAGRREGKEFAEYAKRVRSFDWEDFYSREEGEKFFDWFRREADTAADFVLIDSRTGVTEMGGVCTYQLADVVVLFVAPNEQNLEGCRMIAESLSDQSLIEEGRNGRPLSLLFIPSRVEYGEASHLDDFARRFSSTFRHLSSYRPGLRGNLFDDLKIPYVPYYSYMERVAALEPDRASASELIRAYEKIAAALRAVLRQSDSDSALGERARIFLCYKFGAERDRAVAKQLREVLETKHRVFSEDDIPLGSDWASVVDEELRRCDYLVAFLSDASVRSEMFTVTVGRAWRLSRSQERPVILPVCLGERVPLPYELDAYLGRIQWAYIPTTASTAQVFHEIEQVIVSRREGMAAQPAFEGSGLRLQSDLQAERLPPFPSGAIDLGSAFYVPRRADLLVLNAIRETGVTLLIRGARKMGKSSLLLRALDAAAELGKRSILLDCQLFKREVCRDSLSFFRQLCSMISDALGLEDRVGEYWNEAISGGMLSTRYFEKYILKEVGGPLAIGIDEVDAIIQSEVAVEFFALMRSWHNQRAFPRGDWRRVDILLASASGNYGTGDQFTSPFNVGSPVELEDFSEEEVADLNRRYGSRLRSRDIEDLMTLVDGHPYLVHLAIYAVASQSLSFDELMSGATEERGPFADHLRSLAARLNRQKDLLACFREVLEQGTSNNARSVELLSEAGLVRRSGGSVVPSCRLYADYFRGILGSS